MFEKIHTTVVSAFDEATGVKRRLIDWALEVGREAGPIRQRGEALPRGLAFKHGLADRLVYRKVKKRLGGRLRLPIAGGAPLAKDIAEFFDALEIRIMEGYGLTECTSAATTNHPEAYRYGTVGTALPGFELRLEEDGELLMRSETIFAGYFKDPEATAEVLDADGWLSSGDIATIGRRRLRHDHRPQEGHHRDRGRQEHRSAEPRERPQDSRFISQAIVVGDRKPYAAALVTLDAAEIDVGRGRGHRDRSRRRFRPMSASSRSCRRSSIR